MDKTKCNIVFMLDENVDLCLERGLIGHKQKMDDLPDGTFMIASSYRKAIFGPYTSKGDQYLSQTPLEFYRGVPNPILRKCNWLFPFVTQGRDKGIHWDHAAKMIGVNPNIWFNLRSQRFTDEQVNILHNALLQANEIIGYSPGVINVSDLRRSIHDWNKFIQDEDRWTAQEAYECTEEGLKDILCGGDQESWEICRANME